MQNKTDKIQKECNVLQQEKVKRTKDGENLRNTITIANQEKNNLMELTFEFLLYRHIHPRNAY